MCYICLMPYAFWIYSNTGCSFESRFHRARHYAVRFMGSWLILDAPTHPGLCVASTNRIQFEAGLNKLDPVWGWTQQTGSSLRWLRPARLLRPARWLRPASVLKMIQARQEARKRRKLSFAIRNWDSKDSPYQYIECFPTNSVFFQHFCTFFSFKNWRDNAGREISLNGASS